MFSSCSPAANFISPFGDAAHVHRRLLRARLPLVQRRLEVVREPAQPLHLILNIYLYQVKNGRTLKKILFYFNF